MVELMVRDPGNGSVGADAGLVDGPDLGVVAAIIGGACLDGVDLAGVDRLQTGCQGVRSAVAALEARLVRRHGDLMQAAGCRPDAAAHLTATLGVSSRQARAAVKVAETLAAVPAVEAALSTGDITCGHAEVLAARLPVEHRVAARADDHLVEAAMNQPVDEFRRTVDNFVRVRERDLHGADHARRQHERRRAAVFTGDDGMVRVDALLPPETGAVVKGAIEHIADEMWRDDPTGATAVQRGADAFVELARRAQCGGNPGDSQDRSATRPEVIVTVDMAWLTGQIDDAITDGRLPACSIPGVGNLAPATARRLACDAAIIPMILGGASQPLDVGRRRYRITPAQRRALIVRDGGCVWPGCDRPPGWCQAHHLDERLRHDGPTDLDNLALLCSRHHHDVHEGGQILQQVGNQPGQWVVRPLPARGP